MDRIKQSLADYLVFLKEQYGVEAIMFSFNESNIGINVLHTAAEHSQLIKTLGPYFAQRGLATKLALGDTGDAVPIDFIKPAMKDPEAVKYIGAVDFRKQPPWRAGRFAPCRGTRCRQTTGDSTCPRSALRARRPRGPRSGLAHLAGGQP